MSRAAQVPWPRVVGGTRVRRRRQQLELVHGPRALTMHGAQTIGAGIPSADDHDVAILGGDELVVGDDVAMGMLAALRHG